MSRSNRKLFYFYLENNNDVKISLFHFTQQINRPLAINIREAPNNMKRSPFPKVLFIFTLFLQV